MVSIFTLFVGAAMAEILSAIPTSGGPYFWAYMLAPPRQAPFFSWVTGWFNLLGQVAITTSINFGLSNLISLTAEVNSGYQPTAGKTLGILAIVLLSQVCVNLFSIGKLRYLIYTSLTLNTVGVICLCVVVLAKAKTHQPASFVFGYFYDGTGVGTSSEGWAERASPAYVAVIGTLTAQYTMTGFDASAHLCEETRRAVRDAPMGLLMAILASGFGGLFLLICLLFSVQDFQTVVSAPQPVLQIFRDACGPAGGTVLIVLIMLCNWHVGLFSLTSNSRMMFAFARDGGIPHRLHIIDGKFKVPVRTIAFGSTCSFLLALPSLGSQVAFAGTTSIATVGLFLSYGVPIALTLVYPGNLKRGPFHLGRFSKAIAIVALGWIGFLAITFSLPTRNPVSSKTLNYTPVAVGIVACFAFGSWSLWARKWFSGRCRNHCPVCIRQLDVLGEEMDDRGVHHSRRGSNGGGTEDSEDEEKRLKGGGMGMVDVGSLGDHSSTEDSRTANQRFGGTKSPSGGSREVGLGSSGMRAHRKVKKGDG